MTSEPTVIDTTAEVVTEPAEVLSEISRRRIAGAAAKRERRAQRALAEQCWRTPLTPVQRECLERGLADAKAGRIVPADMAAAQATADQCEET
jgi:predicted transcriptional regulator